MEEIKQAVEVLRSGGVVLFPTDTVWGIGAWVESKKGIEKLYDLKKRDENKPTALLVGSLEQAREYGELDSRADQWVEKYWPGALTVIVRAKTKLPNEVLNDRGGVGLRWPKYDLIDSICTLLPGGIVASSANEAGRESPVRLDLVDEKFLTECDLVIRREIPLSGKASTVVDMMDAEVKIVRQGEVVLEDM